MAEKTKTEIDIDELLGDGPPKPDVLAVTEAELEEAFSGPAMWVNKSYVTGFGFQARLTFAEVHANGKPRFRTAVTMSTADLFKLRDIINKIEEGAVTLDAPVEGSE